MKEQTEDKSQNDVDLHCRNTTLANHQSILTTLRHTTNRHLIYIALRTASDALAALSLALDLPQNTTDPAQITNPFNTVLLILKLIPKHRHGDGRHSEAADTVARSHEGA